MPMVVDWKLADPKMLQTLFANDPLGSSSFDSKPVLLGLESSPSFGGDDGGRLTLNVQSAITNGARNQKTIDRAVGEMNDLWVQSHHVRAIGAYLLDAADRAGVLGSITGP